MIDLTTMIGTDPSSPVQKTAASQKLVIEGTSNTYPVYRIKLDLLQYNPQNDRIATWISQYRADHGVDALEIDAVQRNKIIENFILKSNEDAIKKTERNIEAMSQRRPGVVLSDGMVVDGNRRLTCLRRLARKSPQFGWFEAIILPQSFGENKKQIKMLELSIQHGEEKPLDYDPIERLVGIYNDLLNPETQLLTKEEYAKSANMTPKDLDKLIEQAQYLANFLRSINAEGQFHLARELKLGSVFNEMPAIMKKCRDEEQEQRVEQVLYANVLAEPEGDTVRFLRKFKTVLGGQDVDEFLDREEDLAAEVVERINEQESGNVREAIREIRGDQDLAEDFQNTLEDAETLAKRQKALDSPASALRKALKDLNQVEETVFDCLDAEGRRELADALTELKERVAQIETGLKLVEEA